MQVRLTMIGRPDVAVEGAAADPPIVGRPFTLLALAHERIVMTGTVARVDFDSFVTVEGARYSWARIVGES